VPLPGALVVKESKAWPITSGVMPMPVSVTEIIVYWPGVTSAWARA
jgi:hypothetical protein